MKKIFQALTLTLFVFTIGCVVIPDTFDANINITIRHVEEQADDFLDFVEGESATLDQEANANESSSLQRAIDFISPVQVAYAAEASGTSSPRMQQIAASMKKRFPQVAAIKKTGAVGESNRGMLELVKPDLISDTEKKNEVQRILAAENKDRKALYQEIARLNSDQKMTVGAVEKVYAAKRIQRAQSGDLIQVPDAGEEFDKFIATKVGKALGDQCKKNAWVKRP